MRYDSALKAYIITENDLKKYSVDSLNRSNFKVLIDVSSTKKLGIDLNQLSNPKVRIRIRSGISDERINYWKNLKKLNPNIRKGKYDNPELTYYEDSLIYTVDEVKEMINVMEKLESGLMPEWSQMKKVLYLYDRLREEIIYHPMHNTETSETIRSLRGLISKTSVCSGYAVIFQELMERLGVDCQYVEGATTVEGSKKDVTNHAWNIIKIDGKYYPIDVTWDASGYRNGRKDTFDNFSNPAVFKKSHFPSSQELIKDYEVLSGLRRSYVQKVTKQFYRKKDFVTSNIVFRENGVEKHLVQLRDIKVDDRRSIYKYVMATKKRDGTFDNYRVFYSESNFGPIYYKYKQGKIAANSSAMKAYAKLFSYSHIDSCVKRGTSYIGAVYGDMNNPSGYRINFDEGLARSHQINYLNLKRKNGKGIVVDETNQNVVRGRTMHFGNVYSFSNQGFTQHQVVSENSLVIDDSSLFVDKLISETRLDRRIIDAGGYIGCIRDGVYYEDWNLKDVYNLKSPGKVGVNDILPKNCVENNKLIPRVSFKRLKELIDEYDYNLNLESGKISIKNNKTGKEVSDEQMRTQVCFAYLWLSAAGTKYIFNEKHNGETYAFGDGSVLVYDYLLSKCISSLENTGRIDFSSINGDDMNMKGYSSYKYTESILNSIKSSPMTRLLVHNFFNMQAEMYVSEVVRDRADGYGDLVTRKELDDMLNDKTIISGEKGSGNGKK